MATHRIAVLNGPNLGRLGDRETEHYGDLTYADLEAYCRERGRDLDLDVTCHQTDGEGDLVGLIHDSAAAYDGIVLNAAAYTHTSVAVRDALLCATIPVIEVHLSNPDAREAFRRQNLIKDVVTGSVQGFGLTGYGLALTGLRSLLT